MAALPRGAAIYGTSDFGLVEMLFDMIPAKHNDEAMAMATEILGSKVTDAASVAAILGIDAKRPVHFAMVGPPRDGIEKLVDEFVAIKKKGEREALVKKHAALEPPPFSYARLMVPINDANKLMKALEHATHGKQLRCADGDACKAFTPKPNMIVIGRETHVATYVAGGVATLDVVFAGQSEQERALKALSAFHGDAGGVESTRCQELTTAKGTSLCIVPRVAASAGVATGLHMTLAAIGSISIDLDQAVRIAQAGRDESLMSDVIFNKKPDVLDDGTFTFSGTAETLVMQASWLVKNDGQAELAKNFSEERCASSGKDAIALFEELERALSIKATQTDAEMWDEVKEAGWGAYPVLAGKAWPAYLPPILKQAKESPEAFSGKTCLLVRDGRLRLQSETSILKLLLQ